MDQSQLIANIKEDLVRKKYCLPYSDFKPAWKFAFYNPATKDDQGAVVVHQPPVDQITTTFVALCLLSILLGLSSGNYAYLLTALLLLATTVCYRIFFYKPLFISISATGISFGGRIYRWEDFIGAYMTVTVKGKSSTLAGLVLIQQDGGYMYLDLSTMRQFNRIGTAIRDFQPPGWKIQH